MITLRPFAKEDANDVQRLLNDKDVSRYLTSRVTYPYTIEQAEWWVTTGSHQNPTWAIISDYKLLGCIGYEPGGIDQEHSAEIGYWIGKDHWGKGAASAALRQVTESTLQGGKITRLQAGVFAPNKASMRVLEKCGYVLEGILRNAYRKNGQYYDNHLFATTSSNPYSPEMKS